jgi:hypothetical protein
MLLDYFVSFFAIIPKPLEDADSEVSPDARTRRSSLLEGFDLE